MTVTRRAHAPEYPSMRETKTTYQDATRICRETIDSLHDLRPRVKSNDDRAQLTVLRSQLRKLQRWLEEGK